MGKLFPVNGMQRKVNTPEFFARNPVFSLEQVARELAPPGGRAGTVERLKHHLATGRLKLAGRGLYAVVPPGTAPEALRPDPFLVAAAARPDAVFSHHAALELLGAAHSVWNECTAYTRRRRRPLELNGTTVRFLDAPEAMGERSGRRLGTRKVERRGRLLETTGPERTLVEGFHRPRLAGGLEELVLSAGGFATLDLNLLGEVLARYDVANLWAATGWFLGRTRKTFHVPEAVLERYAERIPASPQYLDRGRRGGALHRRWNLIVPAELERLGGPDER
jgi:predicted transcriptional regulator of viral defense system